MILFFYPASGQSLAVMTYNIRYATENDGVNAWSRRKEMVIELIRKNDPAILGLQEALLEQITDIVGVLKDYNYVGVGRDDGKTAGEFSPILFKKNQYEILEQHTFWLSETPEIPGSKNWDAAITRVATWAKMKERSSGKIFFVFNTHFDHIGKEARKMSADLLKSKAAEISKGAPVIITGDFNCTREEPPYKIMIDKKDVVLIDSAPANAPGTYCTFEVNSVPCVPIDYIFHTEQWTHKNFQVIGDNNGKYYPSDHLPVAAELSLKK